MKQTQLIMGMPITLEVVDGDVTEKDFKDVFTYFRYVDDLCSTYKKTSEISQINTKILDISNASEEVKEIFHLAEVTKKETNGFFDIEHDGQIDPSGIVKGWAIYKAYQILHEKGFRNFYIDAGGDVQVSGLNKGRKWKVGIRNPFNRDEIIKVLKITNMGIATSGTAIRGQHIYNPHHRGEITDIVSMTVVGPNVYDADRFATAAFAMGGKGIVFVENLKGFEGYVIDKNGIATYTKGFEKYCV